MVSGDLNQNDARSRSEAGFDSFKSMLERKGNLPPELFKMWCETEELSCRGNVAIEGRVITFTRGNGELREKHQIQSNSTSARQGVQFRTVLAAWWSP